MVNNSYKAKVTSLIKKSKNKGLVKKYSEYCKTEESKNNALSNDEIIYYTSENKGEVK